MCMCINLYFIPDMKELTDASYMSLTELSLLIKVIYFFVQNRKLQALFNEIYEFDLENAGEKEFVKQRLSVFFKIMIFYYLVSNGGVFITEIGSALAEEIKLPYSGWYPYLDWRNNPRDYWIVFGYQCLGMSSTCNMNVTVDTFACFFMYTISVEMDLLGQRMANMGYTNNDAVGRNKPEFRKDSHKMEDVRRLIVYIKIHQKMLESTETFQGYFAIAFFCQISVSGMVICSLTNELAHVSRLCL